MPVSLSKCKCTHHVMCPYHVAQLRIVKLNANRDTLAMILNPRRTHTRYVKH